MTNEQIEEYLRSLFEEPAVPSEYADAYSALSDEDKEKAKQVLQRAIGNQTLKYLQHLKTPENLANMIVESAFDLESNIQLPDDVKTRFEKFKYWINGDGARISKLLTDVKIELELARPETQECLETLKMIEKTEPLATLIGTGEVISSSSDQIAGVQADLSVSIESVATTFEHLDQHVVDSFKVTSAEPLEDRTPTEFEQIAAANEQLPVPVLSPLAMPGWNNLPLPNDPDQHEEFFSLHVPTNTNMEVIGARVRGKKHKHEGTNCDDWFEVGQAGQWSLIAVSDGAGSKKFSRVGAKESCRAAIRYLTQHLESYVISPREEWTAEMLVRNPEDFTFADADIQHVQQKLHEAVEAAYQAVDEAMQARLQAENASEYVKLLGRDLQINDLSATLLLAVQTNVTHKGTPYKFIMACQIGDGMSCAVSQSGALQLLGLPDSGEFSGETDFLTSKKFKDPNYLSRKTYSFFGRLRALMVMTDGVADDYFPADPEMLRLFDDLVKQGILPEQVYEGDDKASPQEESEQMLSENMQPQEKLRNWLDTYYVRGSFDDRTLVVLTPGGVRHDS